MAKITRAEAFKKILKVKNGKDLSDNDWKMLFNSSSTFFHFKDGHSWAEYYGNKKWTKLFLNEMLKRPEKLGHFRSIVETTRPKSAEWKSAIKKVYKMTSIGEVLSRWISLNYLLPEGHELESEVLAKISAIRSAKRRKKEGLKHWQIHDKIQNLIRTENDISDDLWEKLSGSRKGFQQLAKNYVLACKANNRKWKEIFLADMVKKANFIQDYRILARKAGKDSPECMHAMLNIYKMTKGRDILYRWQKLVQMIDRHITIGSGEFVEMRYIAVQEISRLKKEKKA